LNFYRISFWNILGSLSLELLCITFYSYFSI